VAREHASSPGSSSLDVLPYLLDALDAASRAAGGDARSEAERHVLEGEAHGWMGETERAADAFGRADLVALEPAEARRVRELLAHTLYGLGRFAESAAAYEAAGSARGAATAWTAAREGEKALAAYAPLLRGAPGDAALLDEVVRAARYAGVEARLAALLAEADGAALDGPGRAAWLRARGRLAEALGEPAAAEEHLRRAAEADPADVDALLDLGRVRLLVAPPPGERPADRAVAAWLEALRRRPDDARVASLLWEQAGADYRNAWRSPEALQRTLRVQRAIVDHAPEDGEGAALLGLAWANLGNTLRIAGDHEGARAAYDRARALEPTDPLVPSDRGLSLSALGDEAGALADFEEAIRLDPGFEPARQNAARVLWRMGRDAEALAHLSAAARAARADGYNHQKKQLKMDRAWRTTHVPRWR
jgi:tetratricopeptide (TPR) repeat protein